MTVGSLLNSVCLYLLCSKIHTKSGFRCIKSVQEENEQDTRIIKLNEQDKDKLITVFISQLTST